ncbi:hypothetical protein C8R44DRAFT_889998 [Mycena epipterygia]|nr:hypothetical protein C8R44DRAFT_889998 [Mycena epipterygia]
MREALRADQHELVARRKRRVFSEQEQIHGGVDHLNFGGGGGAVLLVLLLLTDYYEQTKEADAPSLFPFRTSHQQASAPRGCAESADTSLHLPPAEPPEGDVCA